MQVTVEPFVFEIQESGKESASHPMSGRELGLPQVTIPKCSTNFLYILVYEMHELVLQNLEKHPLEPNWCEALFWGKENAVPELNIEDVGKITRFYSFWSDER